MKTKLMLPSFLAFLLFIPLSIQANDKVSNIYNPQKYQQVCKGKALGDAVSFAARGIIWNGTCQTQFIPSGTTKALKGNEIELTSICKSDMQSRTINIAGKEYTGQCSLAFTAPAP